MMQPHRLKLPVAFIALCFFLYLILFTAFRLLFLKFFGEGLTANDPQIHQSFSIGRKFDIMVSSYLVLIPMVLLFTNFLFATPSKRLTQFSIFILKLFAFVVILICYADIPYYKFFKSRITTSVLLWVGDFWQSMKFVFSEKKFYPFILLLLVGWFVFSRTIYFLKKKFLLENKNKEPFPVQAKTMLFVAFATLNVWGARGFNFTRPPGIREAFFTGNSFINQFTLNPVLTFFESFSLFKIDYTDDETSIKNVQRFLNIDTSKQNFSIERNIQNNSIQKRKNIVLVLMESMSANRMGIFGEKKNLTPFLDSLAQQSLFFNNFYSCGIHTCNGVYGTLLGMPSLMAKHPMSNIESSDLIFCGMPLTLKKNNYSTLYFCTHGEEFDNIRYFLPRNGMEKLFGSKDYPSEKIENVWGVNDEFLFDFALNKIDSFAKQDRPFFSTLLTISTHPPQQMPKHTAFKPKSKEVFDQVFEYADFALQQFMQQCKNKSWYNNTIFVFLADHGVNLPGNFEAPLSLNHIPLIIFSPDSAFKKETNADFGIQCDLYPTLMNLLGISYQNNSMGIDLLKQKRLFAYFSQDNRLCVINDKFYLVIDKYGSEYLYQYKSGSDKNYAEQFPALVDSMKTYAYSFLQTTQWMIENKKVGAKN